MCFQEDIDVGIPMKTRGGKAVQEFIVKNKEKFLDVARLMRPQRYKTPNSVFQHLINLRACFVGPSSRAGEKQKQYQEQVRDVVNTWKKEDYKLDVIKEHLDYVWPRLEHPSEASKKEEKREQTKLLDFFNRTKEKQPLPPLLTQGRKVTIEIQTKPNTKPNPITRS